MKTYNNGNPIEVHHHKAAESVIAKMQKEKLLKPISNYGAYRSTDSYNIESEFTCDGFRFVYVLQRSIQLSTSSIGSERETYGIYYEYIGN